MLRATIVLALFALGGCVSAPGVNGPAVQIPITIDNNLIPPTSLTIYLVQRGGIERSLGEILGSGQRMLVYQGLALSGEYQLVARGRGNRGMASDVVTLDRSVEAIRWTLQSNFIELSLRQE